MKKSNKGFTLVELIVVIAIIGVLAAILVPSLMGYVQDSKISTANANAKQVYTAAATVSTKCETAGYPLATGEIFGGSGTTAGTGTHVAIAWSSDQATACGLNSTDTADKAIAKNLGSGDTIAYKVYFVDGAPDGAVAAKTSSDKYVGSYPKESTKKSNSGINSAVPSKTFCFS